MNNYVIDTHILLWLLFSPEKIDSQKLQVLQNNRHRIIATSISFWEISLKYGLGKLSLQGLKPKGMPAAVRSMGIETMDISQESMASYNELPPVKNHRDPFDRIIIWFCIQNGFTFISQDSKLEGYQQFGLKYLS